RHDNAPQTTAFARTDPMTTAADIAGNAELERDGAPQSEIHVEERRPALQDYLRTCVKIGGSDIHLQAGSIPMIRVDGKARFLDCPELTDEQMKEYVDIVVKDPDKREALEHKGATDVAYPMPDKSARFRTNIFHSRERYAIV